ncbi:SgcJ/EcaC family oxidoreductase [Nocardia implantans]|uniref:SgcJ/EcaC family oxidoreductase n=1 Tax=Nocardia implantans TaxID=3108168 RepID=A0ABU6ARJ9_9NOCA|nr:MULTISPECIES: SgcJ/EcaC family oxidoreductase [unclassified Nocardia]MBF6191551.1 SgcJ/EcaC family oxidoreductase [Nocardia beijingensis]MEA3528142.1 SgcJ/EcaC family oxidoreductase [Nocardia sp. CDC192]MEB3510108.1 SgcJ/EcaC family oxidoreductase [Nocardia sp. CDC186]
MTSASTGTEPTVSPGTRRRTVARVVGVAALAAAVGVGGGYLWLDRTSDVRDAGVAACVDVVADGGSADDLRAVCATIATMTAAWDRNDADAFGASFTENATYTTFLGTHYAGRRDLTEAHRALFSGFLKGTELADSFLGVRFFGADVAIVTSRGDRYEGDRPAKLAKTQTYTVVRETDGRWRIASFHNTKRQPVMERISFLFDPATEPEAER